MDMKSHMAVPNNIIKESKYLPRKYLPTNGVVYVTLSIKGYVVGPKNEPIVKI
jgi:hypothetical protein